MGAHLHHSASLHSKVPLTICSTKSIRMTKLGTKSSGRSMLHVALLLMVLFVSLLCSLKWLMKRGIATRTAVNVPPTLQPSRICEWNTYSPWFSVEWHAGDALEINAQGVVRVFPRDRSSDRDRTLLVLHVQSRAHVLCLPRIRRLALEALPLISAIPDEFGPARTSVHAKPGIDFETIANSNLKEILSEILSLSLTIRESLVALEYEPNRHRILTLDSLYSAISQRIPPRQGMFHSEFYDDGTFTCSLYNRETAPITTTQMTIGELTDLKRKLPRSPQQACAIARRLLSTMVPSCVTDYFGTEYDVCSGAIRLTETDASSGAIQ